MQQNTTSLCNECYREIPAVANPFNEDVPMLYKVCPEHGMQRGMLEKDGQFYRGFNTYHRLNHYPAGIISITDKCNAKCKFCYYPCNTVNEDMPLSQIRNIIKSVVPELLQCIILSGGEPTCHNKYHEIIRLMNQAGVSNTMLTNGILLDDDAFFNEAVRCGIVGQGRVKAQISVHGIEQQGETVFNHQISFLNKCRDRGIQVHMVMINLDYGSNGHDIMNKVKATTEFMQEWRDVVSNYRVRTVCDVWTTGSGTKWNFNSDLYKHFQFQAQQEGKEFHLSSIADTNNIYAINTTYNGMNLSLMAAPSLEAIDLGYLGRSPFMLADDGCWYTVPHALWINSGISKGWYRGNRIS